MIKGIHIRKKLRDVLISFAGETMTKDKREMIINAFWPKEQDECSGSNPAAGPT